MEDSTVDHNTTTGFAGGVLVRGNAYIFQTTVTDNSSAALDSEIALEIGGTGSLQLVSSTVSGDTNVLDLFNGAATISRTILDAPTTCLISPTFGTITSRGHNLATDTACSLAATGDQQSTTAGLGALADNGGPVPTRLVAAGSPAIDAAACDAGRPLDARQLPRPVGSSCDTGATENQVSERIGVDCTNPPNLVPGAQLQYCDLAGADLGTDLTNANMTGANLSGAGISPAPRSRSVQTSPAPTSPALTSRSRASRAPTSPAPRSRAFARSR